MNSSTEKSKAEQSQIENPWLAGQVLLFNKPLNWSSFDLVKKVKYTLQHKYRIKKLKVGHAGTLDPLATGVMIICTGKFTKRIVEFQDLDKEYLAEVKIGATTPSFDLESEVDQIMPYEHIKKEEVIDCLKSFEGAQMQVPPIFSAKKLSGVRAYDLARQGETVNMRANPVIINQIELLRFVPPILEIRVNCSKGTYIRSLAYDIGAKLGCGAHLTGLIRSKIGPHSLAECLTLEEFEKKLDHM